MSNQPITLSTAAKMFLLAKSGEVVELTLSWYEDMIAPLLSRFAETPIDQLQANDLRLFRLELREHYSVTTVNSFLRVWKQLYNWLIAEEFIDRSPLARIKGMVEEKEEGAGQQVKAISTDSFTRMLEAAKAKRHLRDVSMLLILYCTGVRLSGLITLRLSKIDWDNGRVWIVNKGRGKSYWGYFDQEGQTAAAIHDYLTYERPKAENDYLFPGQRQGSHINRASVHKMLQHLASAANLEGPCNAHAFRHAFSIAMLTHGASLPTVSKLMGHSKITITADIYGAFEQSQLQEVHGRHNPISQLAKEEAPQAAAPDELAQAFFMRRKP